MSDRWGLMFVSRFIRSYISILLSLVLFIQARGDDMAAETHRIARLLGITKPISVEVVTNKSRNVPKQIQGKNAVSGLTINYGHRAEIWLHDHLDQRERCIRLFIMLHELAHAQDSGLEGNKKYAKESGHYNVVKKCIIKIRGAVLHEWYADWQAIQWIKQHFKKEAQDLTRYFRCLIRQGQKNPYSPTYPSYDQLLIWLEA